MWLIQQLIILSPTSVGWLGSVGRFWLWVSHTVVGQVQTGWESSQDLTGLGVQSTTSLPGLALWCFWPFSLHSSQPPEPLSVTWASHAWLGSLREVRLLPWRLLPRGRKRLFLDLAQHHFRHIVLVCFLEAPLRYNSHAYNSHIHFTIQ